MPSPPRSKAHRDRRRAEESRSALDTTRRTLLATLGSVGLGSSLAGCGGDGGRSTGVGEGTTDPSGSTAPDSDADLGPAPALVGPWPQARADAGNTAAVESAAPTSEPSVRWESTAAGTVGAAVGVPAPSGPTASFQTDDATGVDAAAYVVAEDGRVAAIGADGDVGWRTTVDGGRFPLAATAEWVVVPGRDHLVVLDGDTGEPRRTVDVPDGILYAPTLRGDRAFVGTFSGGVVAVDLASGERRWQTGEPSRAFPPVVVDGVAYAAARRWRSEDGSGPATGEAGVLAAIDAESGDLRWTRALDGHPTAPPGIHDGVVYAGTHRGDVHAVEAASGEERWRESVGDWVTRGPTVAADGIYVVVLGDGPVKLTLDGAVEWRTAAVEDADLDVGTNPVLTEELALFGGPAGVVGVDREDGAVRWRVPTDGPIQFDVRTDDGTAYAGDQYGSIVAIDAASGEPRWELPFQPPTMPGPVVGPRTVAGAGRDGLTYDLLATDGVELSFVGDLGVTSLTPAFLGAEADGDDGGGGSEGAETLLSGESDGSFARARTIDYGDAPATALPPTPTPTATPGPGEETVSPTPHIDFPKPETLWESNLDVEPRSPITYAEGWAYVGTSEGVAAVDARTGRLRLRHELGAAVTGAPALVDDRVFVATRSGRLVAVDLADASQDGTIGRGTIAWEEGLDAGAHAGPAADGMGVVVADESGTVSAVGFDGEGRWSRSLDGRIYGGVAVAGELAFVGTTAGEVVGLSRADGTVEWREQTAGAVHATPAVGVAPAREDGDGSGDDEPPHATVYVGDHGGTLAAFDASTGDVRWQLPIGRWADAPPALGHGAVFVADQTGQVYAVVGR